MTPQAERMRRAKGTADQMRILGLRGILGAFLTIYFAAPALPS